MVVVHTVDPSTWEAEMDLCEFGVSLGCIVRPCLDKIKLKLKLKKKNHRKILPTLTNVSTTPGLR